MSSSINTALGGVLQALTLGIAAAAILVANASPPTRPEQRFVLFRPGAVVEPGAVPLGAREKLQAASGGAEIQHSRWVQTNDFDPASLSIDDRLVIEINPGESVELVVSRIEKVPATGTMFVYARFPDPKYPYNHLFLEFARNDHALPKARLKGGTLDIPGQGRQILIHAAAELPGWSLLREITPGSAGDLEGDLDIVDELKGKTTKASDSQEH